MAELSQLEVAVLILYVVGLVLLVLGRASGLLTVASAVLWVVIVAFVPGLGTLALAVWLSTGRRRRTPSPGRCRSRARPSRRSPFVPDRVDPA